MLKSKVLFLILLIFSFSSLYADDIECYFNWPPDGKQLQQKIVDFIDGANFSLDISIYQLNNEAIIDSIKRAVLRVGASNIRMVTDAYYYNKSNYIAGYKELESLGIKIVTDDSFDGKDRGQCHHKFIIRDKNSILTGSTNFTDNAINRNNNNIIIFNSDKLVPVYQEEFNQMFEKHRFSIKKKKIFANRIVDIGGKNVEVYFSPYDSLKSKILKAINEAQYSIVFCMFTFTDKDILEALIKKYKMGIPVYGVLDRWQATSSYSAYHRFKELGMDVKLDKHKGFLHHKFIVIDVGTFSDPTVISGSYNFTTAADYNNDENIVIIHDSHITDKYFAEFRKNFGDIAILPPDDNSENVISRKPKFLISEVAFKEKNRDWIEIYCVDDGNNGNGVDIGNYYFEVDKNIKMIKVNTIIKTGEYLLLNEDKTLTKLDRRKANANGVINIFARRVYLVGTDEGIIFRNAYGDILDAVFWSNHDGRFSPGEEEDLLIVYRSGNWNSYKEGSGIDSRKVKKGWTITRDINYIDTNTSKDWIITDTPTPGYGFDKKLSQTSIIYKKKIGIK